MRKFIVFFAVLTTLLAAGSLLAALFQCPKCGYEQKEGQVTCEHCGGPLPATTAVPVRAPEAKPTVTAAIMDAEISRVRQAQINERPAIVIVRARNSLALLKLAPDSVRAQAAELLSAIGDAEKKIRNGEQACFACRGSGQRITIFSSFRGQTSTQKGATTVAGAGCPVCDGSGKLPTHASENTIVSEMAKAKQVFEREQVARGWEDAGGIWVPKGVAEKLTIRERAALKSTTGDVCTACYGFGFFGCVTCNGESKIKCTNTKCVQGKEPCPACKGTRKVTATSNGHSSDRSCTACGQLGVTTCTICGGRGYLDCTKCQARGEVRCTTCKGTGENATCIKCDGSGLAPCRSCKGTGELRGGTPCPDCHGEKSAFCTSCNGTGHKQKF